jgi:acyl-coenzyme A synthetase/AMP-(fatty) acid ligase
MSTPNKLRLLKGPRQSKHIAGGQDGQRDICADQHGNLPNKRTFNTYMSFHRDRTMMDSSSSSDRTKDMLLCGGYNVYPRNIEEAIYEHSSVARCASSVSRTNIVDNRRRPIWH